MSDRTEDDIREELRAIRQSISRGVLSMSYDGRTVTYRSLQEMREIATSLEQELGNTAEDTQGRVFRTLSNYCKGY